MNDSFEKEIARFAQASPAAKALIAQSVTSQSVSKGRFLQREGEVLSKAFFVRKGCLRSYAIDAKGKEHIFMFAPEGWIVGDLAFESGATLTQLNVDAIEDSEVVVADAQMLQRLLQMCPELAVDMIGLFRRRIAVLQRRVIMLMRATAEERYQEFLMTYPSIVQRVPQRMIASYLGVTPEALSKIRGEMARRK